MIVADLLKIAVIFTRIGFYGIAKIQQYMYLNTITVLKYCSTLVLTLIVQ